MVRYPFDLLRAVSPSTWLRTLRFSKGKVEPLTMTGKTVRPVADAPKPLRRRSEVSKDERGERDLLRDRDL